MKKKFLETERVYLVEITKDDAPLLLDLDNDPDVMRYLTDGKPSTLEEINKTMERILKIIDKYQYKYGFWLAYTKGSQEFMGWYLFRPDKKNPDDLKNIELGYRLKKKFWGLGYATEVSKEILSIGFGTYQVDSIFAITMKANKASQNVMKKLGMKWEADYTEEDFPGDNKSAVRYRILKKDWMRT